MRKRGSTEQAHLEPQVGSVTMPGARVLGDGTRVPHLRHAHDSSGYPTAPCEHAGGAYRQPTVPSRNLVNSRSRDVHECTDREGRSQSSRLYPPSVPPARRKRKCSSATMTTKKAVQYERMLRKLERISAKCSRPATPATVYATKARVVQTKRGTSAKGRPSDWIASAALYVFGMLFALRDGGGRGEAS